MKSARRGSPRSTRLLNAVHVGIIRGTPEPWARGVQRKLALLMGVQPQSIALIRLGETYKEMPKSSETTKLERLAQVHWLIQRAITECKQIEADDDADLLAASLQKSFAKIKTLIKYEEKGYDKDELTAIRKKVHGEPTSG